ncbi:alpha/beta hydrolase family protein [Rivibacter subsaxonicus]|uniref:Chlorophyllase-like protein n=1 Tax=Rivibacter subsaxonicus TaxID=457575 RepID=A0A4Q7VV78_9BURK|nr:lipase family protein [Rivibacter subsaxonicus]RZU00572.1 chlorophyllase-like protein [Rivibacter subsaxonicus]
MIRLRPLGMAAALSASLLLAACGGDGEDAPPARATIITAQLAGSLTAAQFTAALQGSASGQGLLQIAGAPVCGVDVRYVLYMTRDPAGLPQTASTAALVPNGTDPRCTGGGTGKLPVVVYAHGTTTLRSFNMADVQNNGEASLVAAMFTAQGFIVVAPNYLGYDKSSLQYHPYLNAENQAVDVVDGMRAAFSHLNAASTNKPGAKLFLTGYSQGGHVAMAVHRALERDYAGEFTVTASGPMSGPYNLGKFVTLVNSGPNPGVCDGNPRGINCTVNGGATIFTPMLLTSWQRSYGNVYATATDAYQDPYAATAETLFPTDTPVPDLIAAGKLPADPTFTRLFGTGGLIKEAFRADFFSNTNNGFRKAADLNSLLNFTPKGKVALCYSNADPTVYGFNTTDAQIFFGSKGLLVPALDLRGDLAAINGTLGPAAAQLAGGFQQTYPLPNTSGDHGNAAPFCSAFVRGFFSTLL